MEALVSPNTGTCGSMPGSQRGRGSGHGAYGRLKPRMWTLGGGENAEQSVLIFYVLLAHHRGNARPDFIYFGDIVTFLI